MRYRLRALIGDKRANAATEFAFILPVMIAYMAGVTEFGRAFETYIAVNSLATRYAISYADCYDSQTTPCSTEATTLTSSTATLNMAPQLNSTTAPPAIRVFEVTMSNTAPAIPTIKYNAPSTATTLDATEIAQAQASIAPNQVGVIVTVTYTFAYAYFSQFSSILPSRSVRYTVAQQKS